VTQSHLAGIRLAEEEKNGKKKLVGEIILKIGT